MATIADFILPAEEFALHQTFHDIDDARFETVRVTAHNCDRVLPLLWGEAPDSGHDALLDALRTDPSVAELTPLTTFDGDALFEMAWIEDVEVLIDVLVTRGATILAAHGNSGDWHFRAFFPERDALAATHDFCIDNDLRFNIETIRDIDAPGQSQHGVTPGQHDSLVTAFNAGYYDVPRRVSLSELADQMDVSHQALSQQLRRGHYTLVEGTLIVGRSTALEDQNPPAGTDTDFPT